MNNKVLLLQRFFLLVCVIVFFVWLLDMNIPFAGTKKIAYNFNELNGAVSELYPRARVADNSLEKEKQGRTVMEDPVYFDVRTRVAYRAARLKLLYQNKSNRAVSLGMRIGGAEAKNIIAKELIKGREGKWETVEAEFELSRAPLRQNKYTFLISIPGLEYFSPQEESIIASRAMITLYRNPIWQ